MKQHLLNVGPTGFHRAWDNSATPRLEIDSGDEVVVTTWDAGAHYYTRASTRADAARKPPFSGHPLSGPIFVRGAEAGSTLRVDILEVRPDRWGYTAFYPGRGLLPDDFSLAYLRTWDLSDGTVARGVPGALIPLAPFLGVMGVAPAEAGSHSTMPPRRVGGNMDVKQLVAGSTLFLPVEVPGALFSVGDAHAAQGDGEVCVTGIEMDAVSRLRISVQRETQVREPQLRTSGPPTTIPGPYHGCTAHAADLMIATQNAVRYLIDWLGRNYPLTPEDAYVLCSVAAELRISQVVDAPTWTVTAFFPLSILI